MRISKRFILKNLRALAILVERNKIKRKIYDRIAYEDTIFHPISSDRV